MLHQTLVFDTAHLELDCTFRDMLANSSQSRLLVESHSRRAASEHCGINYPRT